MSEPKLSKHWEAPLFVNILFLDPPQQNIINSIPEFWIPSPTIIRSVSDYGKQHYRPAKEAL